MKPSPCPTRPVPTDGNIRGWHIRPCTDKDSVRWDEFVVQEFGSYCHLYGWKKVFEAAYGLKTHYLSFVEGEEWRGILPVALMPHWPGRSPKAVSLPYSNYGGVLAQAGTDVAAMKSAAFDHLGRIGVEFVELRSRADGDAAAAEVSMRLDLPATEEQLWKQVGDKVRNQVRKAQRAGLTLRWGLDQGEDLHRIYAANMGRLGTPVHSPQFVREIVGQLSRHVDILTVRLEERPIGAMLLVKQSATWSDPMASCLAEFNALNPNMLLYWEALRSATRAGATDFDFGRSHRESGTHRFKKQWGAKEVPLDYQTYRRGLLLPGSAIGLYRGKRAAQFARLWQRLPAACQLLLGPIIRRWIP